MDRYYWRNESVPDGRGGKIAIYDRRTRQEPIAVCADPDVAERITRLLNIDEAERAIKKEPEGPKSYYVPWYLRAEYDRLRNTGSTPQQAVEKLGIGKTQGFSRT